MLGQWVTVQRSTEDTLSNHRRKRLEAIGFVWDLFVQQWEEGFTRLKAYEEREGNCLVPGSFKTDDEFRLGVWVGTQRGTNDTLSDDRRKRLEAIGFVWDQLTQQWEEGFTRLKVYEERKGNCLVPTSFKTDDGYGLGSWVNSQRFRNDTLSDDRRKRLEAIGFVWNLFVQKWEEGFTRLKVYREREGNCLVPDSFKTDDEFRLGVWVGTQRGTKDTLSNDRRKRLEEIGFVWDPFIQRWEEGFTALKVYKEREGNCLVPRIFETDDGYRLGIWVSIQRTGLNKLLPERKKRLIAIGFVWRVGPTRRT